jgi:hypothetical protein
MNDKIETFLGYWLPFIVVVIFVLYAKHAF